jgi:hypothetical protein
MSDQQDYLHIIFDTLSDDPNIWVICDRCDKEQQVPAEKCDEADAFIKLHFSCPEKTT